VDGLQLLDAGRGDQHLDGEETPVATVAQHHAGLVQSGRMPLNDFDDQLTEAVTGITDHLDRVALAGKFDFRRLGVVRGIGHETDP
jgi:hypothetical protein